MDTEHDPVQAGLDFAVRPNKEGFIGKEALERRSAQPPTTRLRCLTIDDGTSMVLGKEPVFANGQRAGYITSAAFEHTVRKPVAYAWLPGSLAENAKVEIEYFGQLITATVVAEPLVDPEMKKIRA